MPQPDGPMSAVTVAGGTDSDTSSRTLVSPNQAETSIGVQAGPRALPVPTTADGEPTPHDGGRPFAASELVLLDRPDHLRPASPTMGLLSIGVRRRAEEAGVAEVKMPPSEATSQ